MSGAKSAVARKFALRSKVSLQGEYVELNPKTEQLVVQSLLRELKALGADTHELRRTGELQLFDARKMLSAFMVNGLPDPLMFRSNVGDVIERLCANRLPCPIRAYGEMVDLLWQEGNETGAIRLEILWNQLASTYDFALLCGYAVGHFYKETRDSRLEEVRDQHTHVVAP